MRYNNNRIKTIKKSLCHYSYHRRIKEEDEFNEQVEVIEKINFPFLKATIDVGNYMQCGQAGDEGTRVAPTSVGASCVRSPIDWATTLTY